MPETKIVCGDALDTLRKMQDNCVHCVVTSPPYFGLRSYLPDGVVLDPALPADVRDAVLVELRVLGIDPI